MPPADNQNLYPDAGQRIMDLMKDTFGQPGEIFNAYFLGLPDNVIIPQDAFPCLIVDKTLGSAQVGPTGTDEVMEKVYIHILVDVKTGFGTSDADNSVKRQLQTLVEGRDPSSGGWLPNTVMYALRHYLTLKSPTASSFPTINNKVNVTYDSPQRPNMPETREAVIDIEVTERTVVGVRG